MRVLCTPKATTLVCAILFTSSLVAIRGSCSLAAYSETRSFRDALDGRSMDEAINGPVDRDTSTYGDRTSPSANVGTTSSPMMLNIPANGNLGNQDEQQKQESELEREAGPVGAGTGFGADQQQQLMEQQDRRYSGRQPQQSTTKSTRAGSGLDATFGEEPATKGRQGPGQQQQQRQVNDYGANGARGPMADDEQQQERGNKAIYGNEASQRQVAAKQKATAAMLMSVNNGMKYSRAMGSSNAAAGGYDKQTSQGGLYGGSRMAQNMMASLANKAAYMQQNKAQQARQQMTPMSMSAMQADGYGNQNGQEYTRAPQRNAPNFNSYAPSTRSTGNLRRANQRRADKKMSPAMVNAMLNKMMRQSDEAQSMSPAAAAAAYQTMGTLMRSPAGAEMLAKMMMPQLANSMVGMSKTVKDQYKKMMVAAIMQQQARGMQQQQVANEDSYDGQAAKSSMAGGYQRNMNMNMNARSVMMTTTTVSPIAAMLSTMLSTGGDYAQQNEDTTTEPTASRIGDSYMGQSRGSMKGASMDDYSQQSEGSMVQGGNYEPRQLDRPSVGSPMTKGARSGRGRMMQPSYSGAQSMAGGMGSGSQRQRGTKGIKSNYDGRQGDNDGFGPNDDQQQQKLQPSYATMIPMTRMTTPSTNEYTSSPEDQQMTSQMAEMADNGQRQEDIPSQQQMTMDGPMGSMRPLNAPMNGFRQAYANEDQQTASDKMADSGYRQAPEAGTKSQSARGPQMARPAGGMQQPYGNQMDVNDQQQQQIDDGYGQGAPMGMAEPFAFDYKIEDNYGNGQYRKEQSDKNGVVRGSYGFMDTKGMYRHVEYVADERGFRAKIKSNEPGLSTEPSKPSAESQSRDADGQRDKAKGSGGNGPDGAEQAGDNGGYEGQQQQTMSSSSAIAADAEGQQQQQQMLLMTPPSQTEVSGEQK